MWTFVIIVFTYVSCDKKKTKRWLDIFLHQGTWKTLIIIKIDFEITFNYFKTFYVQNVHYI